MGAAALTSLAVLLAVWIRSRGESDEKARDRMISAAEDWIAAAQEAQLQIRALMRRAGRSDSDEDDGAGEGDGSRERSEEFELALYQVAATVPRIGLLFGRSSIPARIGALLYWQLERAADEPSSPRQFERCRELHRLFSIEAGSSLTSRGTRETSRGSLPTSMAPRGWTGR